MIESGEKLVAGTKVRIVNFPPPADPKNQFSWNGKIGVIKDAHKIGIDVNNFVVYEYDVFFKNVEITTSRNDPSTGRLIRTSRIDNAENRFNVAFLELAQ